MREYTVPALILLCFASASAQVTPQGWKPIRDSKGACHVAVPPDWSPLSDAAGAAVLGDANTAIAAITSQPGQVFKPLTEALVKSLEIRKDKLFENTAKRIFYQDKISHGPDDPHAYSASVPGKDGTCSCHIVFLPNVSDETIRKIVLSLGPVAD